MGVLIVIEYKKNFKKTFWSYLIIIIAPIIIVGSIVSSLFFIRLAEDTRRLNLRVASQMQSTVETQLINMLTLPQQIRQNVWISNLIRNRNEKSIESFELWRTSEQLAGFIGSNNFETIGIYFQKDDAVIDNYTNYSFEEYYDKYLSRSNYSLDVWSEKLKKGELQSFFAESVYADWPTEEKSIIFCYPIELSKTGKGVVLIAQLRQSMILNNFLFDDEHMLKGFAAFNRDGKMIFSAGGFQFEMPAELQVSEDKEYQVGENTFLHTSSDMLDITYVSVFPHGAAGNAFQFLYAFIASLFLGLIACALLARLGEKRLQKPLSDILDENKNLAENLKERALVGLLYNEQPDEAELSKYNISFDMEKICVIAVSFSELEDSEFNIYLDNMNIVWRELNTIILSIMDEMGIKCYMVRSSTSNSICILNYNNKSLEAVIEQAVRVFKEKHNISLNVGAGDIMTEVKMISQSYDGAVFALRYALQEKNGGVIYHKDIQSMENNKIYYTNEKEYMLKKSIKAGEKESVVKVLGEIYDINFSKRQLSQNTLRRLIFSISAAIYQILDDVYLIDHEKHEKYGRVCQNILRSDNVEECFVILKEICLALCDDIDTNSSDDMIKSKIIKYLNENYTNKDLSLDMLAEHMNVSYNYLSTLFKNYMGTNFIIYLTSFRLKKAAELLKQSNYTVGQVAEKTGFSSSNSFIRTFKKSYGTTPGKYKE